MKIKKLAVVSVAAMAMLCNNLAGICYAHSEIPPEKTAAATASEAKNKLSEITMVNTGFDNCYAGLVTDDGQVYYIGSSRNSLSYIFTLDSVGNITAKAALAQNYANPELRQAGGNICVFYNGHENTAAEPDSIGEGWHEAALPPGGGINELNMVIFDKELNKLASYNVTSYAGIKRNQFIDANSSKVCFAKSERKLYISNYDGSDKKLLFDPGENGFTNFYINSVALTEDHAGFVLSNRNGNDFMSFCGVIDLKTGELTLERNDNACFPESFGNIIKWNTDPDWIAAYEPEDCASAQELVIFKDGRFSTVTTEQPDDIGMIDSVFDDKGRLVTCDYGKNRVFKIYENGKCVQQIRIDRNDYNDYCPEGASEITISFDSANNGIISAACGYFINGKYFSDIMLIPYEN